MGAFGGPDIITDGLVFLVDAASARSYPGSGNTWYDLSGNGDNGTLTNGPTFNSIGSIDFDGTDDYIDLTSIDNSVFTDEATLIIRLKLDSNIPPTTESGIFGFTDGAYRSHYVWSNGLAYFDTFRSSRVDSITLSSLDRTTPHMLSITTKGGGDWKLYQNGDNVHTVAAESTVSMGNNYLGVQNPSSFVYTLKGQVYNLTLYNKALTAAEILQNYNAQKNRFI
tara:strand:- start:2949 stop:3620 length:672 start_codon:yes stop_codon:yes gene_type:complete